MGNRATSEHVKKIKSRRKINSIHQDALNEYNREQQKPEEARRGLRPIAAKYGMNYKTLGNLVNGKRTMSAFNASKKRLTDEEERVLVDLVFKSADHGLPLTRSSLCISANAILVRREEEGYKPVGESWVQGFLDRYHDEIQTHWS
jgi:hypothetical protein